MSRFLVLIALACLCGAAWSHPSYNHKGSYNRDYVQLRQSTEAQAAALTNDAGARATAAKLHPQEWRNLDAYGHEIGRPLLVKPYGSLTNLYAAVLPPRSFVAQIDPTFVKDSYGKIHHVGTSKIGVVAI